MGLFKPAWMTTNAKRTQKAIASLNKLTRNELIEVSLEAPLEEVALAAFRKARYEIEELVHVIIHARHAAVAQKAVEALGRCQSSEGWLTTAMLYKEGHDSAREDAIARIKTFSFLKKISEESKSQASRKLAAQKLQSLEQAKASSTTTQTHERPTQPAPPAPKPEWALSARTRGDVSPRNKSYLFLHVLDESLQALLIDHFLSFERGGDYAIWTTTDPTEVFAHIHDVDFDRMRIFLPVVTPRYLDLTKQALSESDAKSFFSLLQERGIAVVPLFQSEDVIFEFSRLFGEMHGITLTLPDAYDRIEIQLERFTSNANWGNEQLRHAFSRSLFLSYRKKDREQLFSVMKSIHDTCSGQDASIWFDDFLVAGNDFNEEIDRELEGSEAMVLLVTNHLMEGDNYVKQIEYPHARELGKPVVPVEATKTDRDLLSRDYNNLPEPIWYLDREKLNERLAKAFEYAGVDIASDEKDPFHNYLKGMCFLYAVMVEKDVDRAVGLLKDAADSRVADAAEQLALMYTMGFGVKKDANKALMWKLRAYGLITDQEERDETLDDKKRTIERLHDLLYEDDGLIVMLGYKKRWDKSRRITEHFVSLIEQSRLNETDPCYELWRLEAPLMHADALRHGQTFATLQAEDTRYVREAFDLVIKGVKGFDEKFGAELPADLARKRTKLEATAYALKADFTPLYQGSSAEPIETDYQRAIDLFEALEADEHDYETAKLLRSAYGNLASLKKDVVASHKGSDADEMRDAWKCFERAIVVARQLVSENPTTNNLEMLVLLIFEGTQLLPEVRQAIPYWDEGLECIEKLRQLGNTGIELSRYE
ncbi:MAG: TIR domain-containing protein, partial [Coriobacteriales bacterium]|nr:TIR domain-containing protein [Coriobacteriales bacterium]